MTYLASVDHLLQCTGRDQAVHRHVAALAYPESPVLRLQVMARVPAGVDDDYPAWAGMLSTLDSKS